MNQRFAVMLALLGAAALSVSVRSQPFTWVAVEGHPIRMLIEGRGNATVVFENGAGASLEMWGKVQPQVSRFARTVTYDRAGVGLSDPGPSPRDGRGIAQELHDALRAAGMPPPYVLVGASLGGLYVRVFAGAYPEEVSGMVLVDPTDDVDGSPRSVHPELAALPETAAQARESRVPAGLPLVLIDAVSPRNIPFTTPTIREQRARNRPQIEAESRAYERWLETIPGARLVVTDQSGHNVPIEQPLLVIETIRHTIQGATGRSRPQPTPSESVK